MTYFIYSKYFLFIIYIFIINKKSKKILDKVQNNL